MNSLQERNNVRTKFEMYTDVTSFTGGLPSWAYGYNPSSHRDWRRKAKFAECAAGWIAARVVARRPGNLCSLDPRKGKQGSHFTQLVIDDTFSLLCCAFLSLHADRYRSCNY